MQVKRSVAADNDLLAIYRYTFDNYGEKQAENYFAELINTMDRISRSPHLYQERTEFVPPVRITRSGQHLVIYSVEREYVLIVRVFALKHGY